MSDLTETSLAERVRKNHEREKKVGDAFEVWFELNASDINPLMSKGDCEKLFRQAFTLGYEEAERDVSSGIALKLLNMMAKHKGQE